MCSRAVVLYAEGGSCIVAQSRAVQWTNLVLIERYDVKKLGTCSESDIMQTTLNQLGSSATVR